MRQASRSRSLKSTGMAVDPCHVDGPPYGTVRRRRGVGRTIIKTTARSTHRLSRHVGPGDCAHRRPLAGSQSRPRREPPYRVQHRADARSAKDRPSQSNAVVD